MANTTITALPTASTISGSADYFPIDTASPNATNKINRNTFLGVTGQPVDISTTQSLTNKTLDNSNVITLRDDRFTLQDNGDTTKQAVFQLSGITTATTRTYTLPNASTTFVGTDATQTLTNKTLTSPTITGGTYDNGTITVDSIAGHTSATIVTVAGLQISSGVLNTNNSVVTANITNRAITGDKLGNLYAFSVYRTAAQSSSSGAAVKLQFETEEYDYNGNYDNATNYRYTAPVKGVYQFNARTSMTTTRAFISLYKNGSEFKRGVDIAVSATEIGAVASASMQLAAGDYVEVFLFAASTAAITVGQMTTYFNGYLVTAVA